MRTEKILLRLTHYDDDRRYLKKLPAYRLNEAENLADKIYLERVEIYKSQFGDNYMKEFQNDNAAQEMLHIAVIIDRELKLRREQSNREKSEKRNLDDIAIQYIWEDKKITNQNKNHEAGLFPDLKLKNGGKLYQRFNFYFLYPINRLNDQGDYDENKKHLKKLTKALSFLKDPDHIKRAEGEILTFKQNAKKISNQTL